MNGKAGRERAQVTFTIAATRTHITCTARLSVRLSIRASAKLTRCIPVFIARFGRNAMTGTHQCDVYRADASTRRTATRARNIETRKWFHHVAHRRVQTASGHVAKHGSASARRSIFPFFSYNSRRISMFLSIDVFIVLSLCAFYACVIEIE